ncbi:uncharacterized protein LTR77_004171 [Saxophila tyrrhenica]|uniref:Heterokaryon incompatibility domain-containing protein n=1 Tax=Saxophila tyrrhenica TaxID=1690608 RepID=A0AAV9PFB8_9PEZI|nr:hypothetical protein LTR77_004171 [Saxophila tyrrhenica]
MVHQNHIRGTDANGLLCLKCRKSGHHATSCRKTAFLTDTDGLEWFRSPQRNEESRRLAQLPKRQYECQRCLDLDLGTWLKSKPAYSGPASSLSEAYKANVNGPFRRLGTVQDLVLSESCQVCVSLFAIIPAVREVSQTIMLVLAWSAYRLEFSIGLDTESRLSTARYVAAILEPLPPGAELHDHVSNDCEALALWEGEDCKAPTSLRASRVDPSSINISAVQGWLSVCDREHRLTCSRPAPDKLATVRLIDAYSRTIVPYTNATQEYLALSYVWGNVNQSFDGAGCVGAQLPELTRTVEDAITLTVQFGARYLWVDAVCIKQTAWEDKQSQIAIMHEIYQGSFLTIIALSGKDAFAGLPRVTPGSSAYRQLSCSTDTFDAVLLGPTLRHIVDASVWASRGWTYQEALLSPRCLYMTQYQAYFECNAMACCESIDTAQSPLHNPQTTEDFRKTNTYSQRLNLGSHRNPLGMAITDRGEALNLYTLMSLAYSCRQLSYQSDALAAYSGILGALKRSTYFEEFFWGLPCEALNWAMMWQAQDSDAPQRDEFPTWSWLSCAGGAWPGGPGIGGPNNDPDTCPFDMTLYRWRDCGLCKVFGMTIKDVGGSLHECNDPLRESSHIPTYGSYDCSMVTDSNELERLLGFDSFALNLAIDECWEKEGNGSHSFCRLTIDGHTIYGKTTYVSDQPNRHAARQLWLLLARHVERTDVMHWFVLLKQENGRFVRKDMLRLEIPRDRLGVLSRAPAATAKIATKSGHKQRSSLLGGSGNDYQPLSGASFSSARQPYVPGGYHDRQGLPTTTTSNVRQGKGKMYMPNSLWTWSFFGIALFQAIICLGLEAYVFGEFETSLTDAATDSRVGAARTIPTYLAIFIFGFFYQLVLVWDGLRARNTIQVIGLCLYNLGMMIYAAVEMDQVNEAVSELGPGLIDTSTWEYLEPCLIAVPCVLALGTVLLSLVAWKLYDEFAWTIYKHISADLRLKRRYLQYQIYIALLKFDFFFFVGFTVQFLVIVHGETYEFALTIAALVVTVLLLFLATWICRRESYVGQSIIITLYFAGMAYFVFKLVRMYDSTTEGQYVAARHSLTTFAVLTILLLIVTMVSAVLCMMNFNKGLMPHLHKGKGEGKGEMQADNAYAQNGQMPLGSVGSRMTID